VRQRPCFPLPREKGPKLERALLRKNLFSQTPKRKGGLRRKCSQMPPVLKKTAKIGPQGPQGQFPKIVPRGP